MTQPLLLDLFCGAGGAAKGYQQAGFYVIGVDIEPQPHYCGDEFCQVGALQVLRNYEYWRQEYVAIHASPPCQAFTAYRRTGEVKQGHPNFIGAVRPLLQATGLPYVIENVPGAPLEDPTILCGSMFKQLVDIRRHRLFETNWPLDPPGPCNHALGVLPA